MTVNAATHHMMADEVQFECDTNNVSHLSCCSSNEDGGDSVVFTNRTDLESLKLFSKAVDVERFVRLEVHDLYNSSRINFVPIEPISFLIGSTIKRE